MEKKQEQYQEKYIKIGVQELIKKQAESLAISEKAKREQNSDIVDIMSL